MPVVGFDFGTTNSLVSLVRDGKVFDLLDDVGLPTPSVVRYEGVRKTVGREAREALDEVGLGVYGTFVKSPKTYLGDESIVVGGRELSPIDVTHDVIEHVVECALASPFHRRSLTEITDVVATIPVNMNGHRRQALRDAYARAGIRVVQFVHEPFAALYGHFRPHLGTDFVRRFERKNILVVDWGGGTLDLTLCRMDNGRVVQLQNSGTNELGGDVIDNAIRNWILTNAPGDFSAVDPERRRQLRNRAERLKIDLSSKKDASLWIRNFGVTGEPLHFAMSREQLDSITKPFVDRAMDYLNALLGTAHISDSQVAMCLVTGGMSRMPAIVARLREFFGTQRVEVSENSGTLIAQGAAWIAHDRQQLELAKDIEVRLARGSYLRVLRAGTPVPFEGQELSAESELFCSDPRDGHAKFQICTPARPGAGTQRSDPRDDIGSIILDVDSKSRPLTERLTLNSVVDSDGVLHMTAMAGLARVPESTSLHDLEFGISFGSAEGVTHEVTEDEDTLIEGGGDSVRGDVVVRANITDSKDEYAVPGEVLYKYNPTYFSRAKRPPQVQVDEHLYYAPCAVCKRRSNDPDCRCGSVSRRS